MANSCYTEFLSLADSQSVACRMAESSQDCTHTIYGYPAEWPTRFIVLAEYSLPPAGWVAQWFCNVDSITGDKTAKFTNF